MKELQFLIIIIALFQSCGSQMQELDQNDEPNEPEETITFERYVENVKTPVRQTVDGGYIVAGGNNGQAWLMKLDKYGEEEWQNTYTLGDFGYSRSVVQTNDGGYLYAGYEDIVKVDSNCTE